MAFDIYITQIWVVLHNGKEEWFAIYNSFERPKFGKSVTPLYSFKLKNLKNVTR